jgi:hypothetical protein
LHSSLTHTVEFTPIMFTYLMMDHSNENIKEQGRNTGVRIDYVTKAMETKGCGIFEIGEYSDFNWRKAIYYLPDHDAHYLRYILYNENQIHSAGATALWT